jgi:RNA polymerase sigma factor (sigma-70 family)
VVKFFACGCFYHRLSHGCKGLFCGYLCINPFNLWLNYLWLIKNIFTFLKYQRSSTVFSNMTAVPTVTAEMTAGKRSNITSIINDYSKRLMGFIRKRVSNEADAEDILQDVFYQLAGNTEPVEQVSGWLFRVTRNKIIDKQRKMKPLAVEDVFDGGEEGFDWTELLFDDTDNPETEYLRNLFWEELQRALDELPPEQKDAFVMTEIEGIPFKVIAEETGVSVNTLLSRKRYAVLHLRERLLTIRDELLK